MPTEQRPQQLFHRIDGADAIADLVDGRSDTEVLVALAGRPALLSLPGKVEGPHRFITVLLHGNEDSGFRALCRWLRTHPSSHRPLWLFIGNVRAATENGWFADRYLGDQEDFNRVWGVEPATTRMRLCAQQVLKVVTATPLEAAIDIHNNTGDNPMYAILPQPDAQTAALASLTSDIGLIWGTQEHTLMQVLQGICPAVAVECGRTGVAANVGAALRVLERFVAAEHFGSGRPERMLEVRYRTEVRREVSFGFSEVLGEQMDLAITPGLDAQNFGLLQAGTLIGHTVPGGAVPLIVLDDAGRDATPGFLQVAPDGRVTLTRDVIPAMMTRTAEQTRRDCLFYILSDLGIN